MTRHLNLGAVAVLAAVLPVAGGAPVRPVPSVQVGPYTVQIASISQTRRFVLDYSTPGPNGRTATLTAGSSVQLQVAVYAPDSESAGGLASLTIRGITAEGPGKPVELTASGNLLEMPADPAVLRGFLYLPEVPPRAGALRALHGELVSYRRARQVEIELEGTAGSARSEGGIRVSLLESVVEAGVVRLRLKAETEPGVFLVPGTSDGTLGVTVFSRTGRLATPLGGTLVQPVSHQAELRVAFQDPRGPVGKVRVRLIRREGPRRVQSFRMENVPLALPAPDAEQHQ